MTPFDQATVMYTGPSGRAWQLMGVGQENHPVSLRPRPVGLFGAPLQVNQRDFAGRRGSRRTGTLAKSPDIELQVHISCRSALEMGATLSAWMADWPEDGRTGWLQVHTPQGGWRSLAVYRREAIEALSPHDPMASLSTKQMIVCSSDDPYPQGGAKMQVSDGTLLLRNPGEVTVYPQLRFPTAVGEVEITASNGCRVPVNIREETLIDLAPNRLTATTAAGTRALLTKWGERPSCPVEPGATVNMWVPAGVECWMPPRFVRLYG